MATSTPTPNPTIAQRRGNAELEWVDQLKQRAASLKYGQVTVTIHEGRVVQLEVSEKTRFEPLPPRSQLK